eukprot:evm.model.scf_278.4 EVM.evm.TU.scf_278.4   scf_278:103218-104737(+)
MGAGLDPRLEAATALLAGDPEVEAAASLGEGDGEGSKAMGGLPDSSGRRVGGAGPRLARRCASVDPALIWFALGFVSFFALVAVIYLATSPEQ